MFVKIKRSAIEILNKIDQEADLKFGEAGTVELKDRPDLYVGADDLVRKMLRRPDHERSTDLRNVRLGPSREDESLVGRLREHQPGTMEELYDLYGRLLYVLIVRIVRNPSVAEDLVQETFLRAWNRSTQLSDDDMSVGPWLVGIARHCALGHLKSSQAVLSAQTRLEDAELPAVTIDQDVLASDRARALESAFRNLSENQKRLIQLSFYEGLSQVSIAERLYRPRSVVERWKQSILSRLKRTSKEKLEGLPSEY